jgi:hypothetical protein
LGFVLYEDDVVAAVADSLTSRGWVIVQRLRSTQRGDDIVATRGPARLVVEAKGGTSAVPTSKRFSKPFSGGQAKSHVGQAVLRALRVVTDGHIAAVALPDDSHHRREVGRIRGALERLDIAVLWVDDERRVSVDPASTFLH